MIGETELIFREEEQANERRNRDKDDREMAADGG